MFKEKVKWFDNNILKICVIFLIAFIPLYPKFPLLDIVHTWVYIRIDDIVIGIVTLIFGVQLIRKKATLKTPLTVPIAAYWILGLLTTIISLIFIVGKIPHVFSSLVILHYIRRIEYLIVFFVAFNSVKSKKDLLHYSIALGLTLLVIVIYAFGQKTAGLPAILTMNEEFAKGKLIRLPDGARLTATFAGHYDLAAYLVFVIPIIAALVFAIKRWIYRIPLIILGLLANIILLLTQSRISIGAYGIAIIVVFWLLKKKWLIAPIIIGGILLVSVVPQSAERFKKTFRVKEVAFNLETGQPAAAIQEINKETNIATAESQEITKEELPVGTGFIGIPSQNAISDINKQDRIKYIHFKKFANQELAATGEAKIATLSGEFIIRKAIAYDISFTTRIQGEWPTAIAAFKRNLILGSGFSAAGVHGGVAVDNDYLRMLGESGVLGTITFLSIFAIAIVFTFRAQKKVGDSLQRNFSIGVVAGIIGLFLNAILIDVFEASKVAYSFWLVLGISIGSLYLYYPKSFRFKSEIPKLLVSNKALSLYLLLIIGIFFIPRTNNYFVGDDFTWLRWAAESSTKDLASYFTRADGFFYRPIQKALYLIMYNLFWLAPKGYHLVSMGIHIATGIGVYLLAYIATKKRWVAFGAGLIFAFLASNSESVFWVSTLGNLLSVFFTTWSIYLYISSRTYKSTRTLILSFILSLFAMFSYEGGIVAPITIVLWEMFNSRKNLKYSLLYLTQIPAYILLRLSAGSHGLSGDYSYNYLKLPLNIIGNLAGYLSMLIFGPRATEPVFNSVRSLGRDNLPVFIIFALLLGSIATASLYLALRKKAISSTVKFFTAYLGLALLPFLGLGNISTRYSYVAAPAFAILAAFLLSKIYKKTTLAIVIFFGFIAINAYHLNVTYNQWVKAGNITQSTITTLGNKAYPKEVENNFIFVNKPIRYGLAWIFPVGLEDAIWHRYPFANIKVYTVGSIKEALSISKRTKSPRIFNFQNNKLKEVQLNNEE